MSAPDAIWLLNCRCCDDWFRVIESCRSCQCAHVSGKLNAQERPEVEGLQGRLIRIDWEEYDGAALGEPRQWVVELDELPANENEG